MGIYYSFIDFITAKTDYFFYNFNSLFTILIKFDKIVYLGDKERIEVWI